MPSRTTILDREDQRKIRAFMEISQGDEDYNAVIEGTFEVDQTKKQKFRNRITIKDYQVTGLPTEGELATEEEIEKFTRGKALPEWLQDKMGPFYTNEYIAIKRREHISAMLEQIENMESTFGDRASFSRHFQLFLNEIRSIYKNFIKTRQDDHFLSIVNLLEEVFDNNEVNKKVIKESKAVFKAIKDKDVIDYSDYERIVRRFFDQGIDVVSIEEKQNEA